MVRTGEDLILASASLTRHRLLADAGLEVRVEPAQLDEGAIKCRFRAAESSPAACALALAEAKARHVAAARDQAFVIGADQILVCGGEWFDKPLSLADARVQLHTLCGRTHELLTAACVVQQQGMLWHTVTSARLTMRDFSDAFLDAYLGAEGSAILGSVGSYRLEGRGIQLFARIEGDYFAILGLPLLELLGFLRDRRALAS
jgi:nucleoside triphosphate pyrophosphatase